MCEIYGSLRIDVGPISADVVLVYRAGACGVELGTYVTETTVYRGVDRACVRDIKVLAIGRECNAIGLDYIIRDEVCGAGGRAEAVAGNWELRCRVCKSVEPT